MQQKLRITFDGAVAVPLARHSGPGDHPDTDALLLGGRHRAVLAVPTSAIWSVDPQLQSPQCSHVLPDGTSVVLFDLEKFPTVSVDDGQGGGRFQLGAYSANAPSGPYDAGSHDLAYALHLGWMATGGAFAVAQAATGIVAKVKLDRGTLRALPLPPGAVHKSWQFASGRKQPIAAGLLWEVTADGILAIVLTGKDNVAYRVELRESLPEVGVSAYSMCGYDGTTILAIDTAEYQKLNTGVTLVGATASASQITPPFVGCEPVLCDL